jgi:hypothetical protein
VSQKINIAAVHPYHFFPQGRHIAGEDASRHIAGEFRRMAGLGVTGVAWSADVSGRALYRTRAGTPFANDPRRAGRLIEPAFRDGDVLEMACAAARDANLELLIVTRPYDDYFPGLGSQFEAAHHEMLWESRGGEFRMRGVLSLSYDEVREYRLSLVDELLGYDAAGVVVSLESCVAPLTPFRRRDFFGFNCPIAAEHKGRTGEDIRAFEDIRYRRGADLQIVDAEYLGGEFNRAVWHEVKGAFFERFLAEVSRMGKARGKRVGFMRGREEGVLPMARLKLREDKWLKDGLIDDLLLTRGPGEDKELSAYLAARRPGARVAVPDDCEACDAKLTGYEDICGLEE